MSSSTIFVNWTASAITVNLNGTVLPSIRPAQPQYAYYPYSIPVPRDVSQSSGKPGVWGRTNALTVTCDGQVAIYNNLDDPSGAAPNVDLLLWAFPGFLVFSQLDRQLGGRVRPSAYDPDRPIDDEPKPTLPRNGNMATAYFVNSTPTVVKILLNGGDQQNLDAISVDPSGKKVLGPAWGATVAAFNNPNIFGGNGKQNQLVVRSEQMPGFVTYLIESTFSSVLNLFFFIFEDTIVGEDQTGSSSQIKITRVSGDVIESLATAGARLLGTSARTQR